MPTSRELIEIMAEAASAFIGGDMASATSH